MSNQLKNQPAYYVPYARLRKDIDGLKAGAEYPINQDNFRFDFKKNKIKIMVHVPYACNIIEVPLCDVDLFVNVIVPKFKIGSVVAKTTTAQVYRVYEHSIVQGKVWYRDGWSEATGLESGCHEDKLRQATDLEAASDQVKSNDNLVKEKKPDRYQYVMSNQY